MSPSTKSGSDRVGVSDVKTVLNLIMSVIGIGVLALPKGIAEGGWAVSILMFVVTCSLSHVAVVLLHRCLYFADPKRPLLTYQAVGEAAFGPVGKTVVAIVNYLNLFTVCACMLILLGDSLEVFWSNSSKLARLSVAAVCVLPLAWLPSLKEVAAVSVVGVCAVFLTCAAVVAFCALEISSEPASLSAWPSKPMSVGISFANFMNSYTVAPVVPSIVASMRNPEKFPTLSLVAFAIVSVVFLAIGFSGYLAYGAGIRDFSSVGDAINKAAAAEAGRTIQALNITVQVGILLVCLSHFVSLFNPVALATEQLYLRLGRKREVHLWPRLALRTAVVAACYGLAAGVNNFTSLVNLLGATFVMLLQIIFPFAFHHALAKRLAPAKALSDWITYGLVALGFLGMGVGTYASIASFKI